MLWIGGYVTTPSLVRELLIPSLVCLILPLIIVSWKLRGEFAPPAASVAPANSCLYVRNTVLMAGIGVLLFVPVFKTVTHLPPYMGMLLGLGILWIIIEVMNNGRQHSGIHASTVPSALKQIDMASILFFLGILMSVSALESTGQLSRLADWLGLGMHNLDVIVVLIGFFSAVIDNVPLVAGAMGMYDISIFPHNHRLWTFLAYCAGTGGSMLIIGSVAGIAAMGMVKMDFFWYLRKISPLALAGFLGGAACFVLMN
jgi:Na+/H+ antiporter NhaD/arsenite permease-like protein